MKKINKKLDLKGLSKDLIGIGRSSLREDMAKNIFKLAVPRNIPEDLEKMKQNAPEVTVVLPEGSGDSANYMQIVDLVGEDEGNRVTMTAEKLTRIPNFSSQKNGPKPMGIWYACGNDWLNWVSGEMPHWIGEHIYSIELDEDKVLIINTEEEFIEFSKEYEVERSRWSSDIDWQKVAMKYSGIEICPYQWKFRSGMEQWGSWYGGWDVASGCIWDADAIKSVKLIAERSGKPPPREYGPEHEEEPNWKWFGHASADVGSVPSEPSPDPAAQYSEKSQEAPPALKEDLHRPLQAPGPNGNASFIKGLNRPGQALYRLDPPLDNNEYVIVSAIESLTGEETYIFPANENGEVSSYLELPGSLMGTLSHEKALENAGYSIK